VGLPPAAVLALAAGPSAALATARLVRLALLIHASQHSFGPCRGAGFLGMGVLAAGLTVVVLALAPAGVLAVAAAAGLCVAVVMFVLGLLLLPGAATTPHVRLRRGLDGASIAVTLAFTFWLAVSPGVVPPLALAEGLVVAGGLAVVTVVAVRAAAYRRAALLCGAGASTTVLGLSMVAIPLAYGRAGALLPLCAGALLAGPALTWQGARRADAGPAPAEPGAASLAGYPLLTIPVATGLIMAGYHLIVVGAFDRTAMAFGLTCAMLLATREALGAADVRRYTRRLARQEAHFRSLVGGANDLILVLDEELVVRWQSPAAARLFGLSDQDVLGRPFLAMLHPDDIGAAGRLLTAIINENRAASDREGAQEVHPSLLAGRLRDGFGRWRDTESSVTDQRGGSEVDAIVLHLRDVSDRRHLEQAVHRMSCTDQLTSLPNRRELMRAVQARRGLGAGAVLAIDLHGLSVVNGERGREVGDAVLVEVARRLRTSLGPDDQAARLGGDEFGVFTVSGPVQAYALALRVLAELTRPYELPGAVVILHASIGLAEVADGKDVEDVMQRADLACRRARQIGPDRLEWFDVCLEEQLMRHLDIERELPGAVARGELDLAFQPIVNLLDRRPAGVEALLRWRHPTLGTVLPAEVIPAAERLEIAGEIGQWVLANGCRHLSSWLAGGKDVWLSVNMSPRQLTAPDFVARVDEALAAYRLPPDRLVVEVAEGKLDAELPSVVTHLSGLRALGVRTALDDFGAGQASLAQLRRLPIDILKLDGTLVCEPADRSGPTQPLIDVAVSLGRRLGVELIAEGLESRSRLDEALRAGCRIGQGFLLGRPLPAEHLEAYLEDYRTPSL
jgi:diguanylate cyclase (GGDEF)-like protein/PAS domain S-box-containing protein